MGMGMGGPRGPPKERQCTVSSMHHFRLVVSEIVVTIISPTTSIVVVLFNPLLFICFVCPFTATWTNGSGCQQPSAVE